MTLELGGKSPNIVFDDADIEGAVRGAVSGIFAATGQTCIAGSRLLVQDSIHDAFTERLVAFAATARMGDPASAETQVGPITTKPQYAKVLDYIQVARDEGAECVLGGGPAERPECGDGWFVEPTIFTGVENRMRIAQEEVFGPVLSVIRFKDEDEAVAIANDIAYGLAAGVWTQSIRRAITVSERAARRHGVGQHLPGGELHVAVRRLQALRPRARERPGGHPRVPADEKRVDQHGGRGARPLRHTLVH